MKNLALLFALQWGFIIGIGSHNDYWSNLKLARGSCPSSNPPGAVCKSCSTVLNCIENPGLETDCSSCGLVCGESGILAGCYQGYDGTDETTITNSNCICKDHLGNGYLLQNGNYSDPYDSSTYVSCSGGVPSYHTCPENNIFDAAAGSCILGAACPEDYTEAYFELPLNCDSYLDCSTGQVESCLFDSIFDLSYSNSHPETNQCIDPIVDACGETTPGTTVTHPDVCYLSYICDTDDALIYSECCPIGQYYNDTNLECEAITTGSCTIQPQDVGYCIQEFWERETCNQCNGEIGKTYATRTPCSMYYYECVDEGGVVLPNLVQCNESTPIFDATTGSCSLESEVVACQIGNSYLKKLKRRIHDFLYSLIH